MVKFKALILKFDKKGEKTGWTYILIPANIADKIKPGNKKSFRVRGKLDDYSVAKIALLPMGKGEFILPLNAGIRKGIGKRAGAMLYVMLEEDKSDFILNADMITCLKEEPVAMKYFQRLPVSHQRYFSKWIDGAKTDTTKTNRISLTIQALARGMGYAQMIRENIKKRI